MTMEDVAEEVERQPFVPLRLHLASGKTIDIPHPALAWVRQRTLLILERPRPRTDEWGAYEVVALRLIERIEQIKGPAAVAGGRLRRGKR